MTKLFEIHDGFIKLTPQGQKLAEDLRAGHIVIDKSFDESLQGLIDKGLMVRVGDNLQVTEKGAHIYRYLSQKHMDAPVQTAAEIIAHEVWDDDGGTVEQAAERIIAALDAAGYKIIREPS